MKKNLLLLLMAFALAFGSKAQVIELIGEGVFEDNTSTLIIPNPSSVEKVVVVATGLFEDFAVPADVTFSNFEGSYDVGFQDVDQILTYDWIKDFINTGQSSVGYYAKEFDNVDNTGITYYSNGQGAFIKSLTAYVYRKGINPGVYSDVQGGFAYAYHNGLAEPLEYNFTIPGSNFPRDIKVTVPFTDLESNDLRPATVILEAGGSSTNAEFDTNNAGDLLHIEPLTLANVPGNITQVKVTVYSKTTVELPTKGGDSFVTGPVLLTTTYDQGCTLTQGYWKRHADPDKKQYDATWGDLPFGPNTDFFLSGQTWIDVFNTSVKGNAYYILAHQYMAAVLNTLAGSYASPEVSDAISTSEGLFSTYTPTDISELEGDNPLRKQFVELAELLDDYNNGELGPVHCEDMEKSAVLNNSTKFNEFSVYPNPASNIAIVSFNPVSDGMASVELYNALGQRLEVLFNENVQKDVPIKVEFNVNNFNKGLYILQLKNNNSISSKKFNITK